MSRQTPHPPDPGRGEPVVQRVIAATVAELALVGYRGLRIEDVATRAGVNKTTVYRRWPTKEDLIGAALRSMTTDKLVPPNTGSLRGDLLVIARGMVATANTDEGRSLFRVMLAEGPESEIAAIAHDIFEADRSVVRAVLESSGAQRDLAPGVDPMLLFDILVSYLHHKMLAHRVALEEADLVRLVDVLLFGALHPEKRAKAERET